MTNIAARLSIKKKILFLIL